MPSSRPKKRYWPCCFARLRVWNVRKGEPTAEIAEHANGIAAVAALDANRLVSGGIDGRVKLWAVDSASCLGTLVGHAAAVTAVVAHSPKIVASGCRDGDVRLWNVATLHQIATLRSPPGGTAPDRFSKH